MELLLYAEGCTKACLPLSHLVYSLLFGIDSGQQGRRGRAGHC